MFYEKNKIVEIIISWFFIDNSIRLKNVLYFRKFV